MNYRKESLHRVLQTIVVVWWINGHTHKRIWLTCYQTFWKNKLLFFGFNWNTLGGGRFPCSVCSSVFCCHCCCSCLLCSLASCFPSLDLPKLVPTALATRCRCCSRLWKDRQHGAHKSNHIAHTTRLHTRIPILQLLQPSFSCLVNPARVLMVWLLPPPRPPHECCCSLLG